MNINCWHWLLRKFRSHNSTKKFKANAMHVSQVLQCIWSGCPFSPEAVTFLDPIMYPLTHDHLTGREIYMTDLSFQCLLSNPYLHQETEASRGTVLFFLLSDVVPKYMITDRRFLLWRRAAQVWASVALSYYLAHCMSCRTHTKI